MEYLLKASAVILIFYACYKLCLQKDTFFEQNRWFLLIGLTSAICIPFIVIPIYIKQTPISLDNLIFMENAAVLNPTNRSFDILSLIKTIYLLGVIIFSVRFIFQLTSLLSIIVKNKTHKLGRYKFVKTTKEVSPFSFFNYIVYTPKQFNDTELKQIISHEKVHVRQHHTIDVLLAQLACIAFWFNPFIWLYNKDLKQNLEFIADKTAIQYSNCKKSYQYTLLKASMTTNQLVLTNNFYNSLIKKRIVMLHKSKSRKVNLLKYLLIIPLLTVFLMSFNTKKVFIKDEPIPPTELNTTEDTSVFNQLLNTTVPLKNPSEKPILNSLISRKARLAASSIEVIITKDFSDSDFDKLKTKFKNEGVSLKVKGVKRNKEGEITAIKIEVSSKSSNANYNIDTDEAINPIKISIDEDGKNISIGNGHKAEGHNMVFVSENGKKHVINHSGSDNNVFIVDSDNTDMKYTFKSGDSILVKKIHKKTNSDEDVIFITTDNDEKAYKLIKIKEDKNTFVKSKNGNIEIVTKNGKDPLYLVNGKEASKQEISDLKPDTIKSVEVLKGDNATEKYGKEGENGVIQITTKKKD